MEGTGERWRRPEPATAGDRARESLYWLSDFDEHPTEGQDYLDDGEPRDESRYVLSFTDLDEIYEIENDERDENKKETTRMDDPGHLADLERQLVLPKIGEPLPSNPEQRRRAVQRLLTATKRQATFNKQIARLARRKR